MPRIKLKTGITLDYFESGNYRGKTVLLIHGWGDSWRTWEASLRFLPLDYRYICMTQRGFGDSDKPESGYRQLDFLLDLDALLEALKISNATLVGHSMGGMIAHHFAIEFPQRVNSLILVSTTGSGQMSSVLKSEAKGLEDLQDPIAPEYYRDLEVIPMGIEPSPEILETVIYEIMKTPARVLQQAMNGMLEENHFDRLSEIAVPTLILYGEKEMYFSEPQQQEMADAIPDARLKCYPNVGHGLQWEMPEQFAEDFAWFMTEKS
jgi:pimeloyl-ACP methyl ester carboxylesterase